MTCDLSRSLNFFSLFRSISDICRGKASGGTPYHPPSDLLVAHTQIPKGYEKKPPSIIIRDSNPSPFLNSAYPDVKPAGSGTGWTSQAFAPDNSSGGICSQLPLQPSRKFLPKSQPAVTENIFSPPASSAAPSGGFSHSSGEWWVASVLRDVLSIKSVTLYFIGQYSVPFVV